MRANKEKFADFLPVCIYPLFFITLLRPDALLSQTIAGVVAVTGFVMVMITSQRLKEQSKPYPTKGGLITTFFFAIIYIIVAALAIGQALETFNSNTLQPLLTGRIEDASVIDNIMLMLAFFSIAIIFFQGGTTYLATDAASLIVKKGMRDVFLNFIVLFTEAIIIFFIASNINSFTSFVTLSLVLLGVDILWILCNIHKRQVVFVEWLHLNSMSAIFLVVCLVTSVSYATYFILAIVLVARTTIDYKTLWVRFYSKYAVPGL